MGGGWCWVVLGGAGWWLVGGGGWSASSESPGRVNRS